jgi:hypothetical protein
MYCPNCGKEVGAEDRFCSYCSYRLVNDVTPQSGVVPNHTDGPGYVRVDTKSTGWALFLSIIIPGLGAYYVDKEVKGLVVFLSSIIMLLLTPYFPFTFIIMLILWIYGVYITSKAIDSYKLKNNIR